MAFLVPGLGIFVFSRMFEIRQIWGCWFQIWQFRFQIAARKYLNKIFLGPNRYFHFFLNFCSLTNWRMLISNMTIFFSNSIHKIPKEGNFDPKFLAFLFFPKFCSWTNSRVLISNMTIFFSNSRQKIRY